MKKEPQQGSRYQGGFIEELTFKLGIEERTERYPKMMARMDFSAGCMEEREI